MGLSKKLKCQQRGNTQLCHKKFVFKIGTFLPLALPRPRGAAPTGAGAGVPAAAAGADRPRDLPRAAIMYLKLAIHECGVSGDYFVVVSVQIFKSANKNK